MKHLDLHRNLAKITTGVKLGTNIHPVPEFLVADELDLRSVRKQHTGGSSTSEMLRSTALHVSRINHGAM